MPLTPENQDCIESFRLYIEDSLAADDRYGPPTRQDQPEQMRFASAWIVAPSCWFEVAVTAKPAQVRLSFVTDDVGRHEAVSGEISESGQKPDDYIAGAMSEAGVNEPLPAVESSSKDHHYSYTTSIDLDELRDLEDDGLRDRALRILEAFIIAFAPALAVDDMGD